jgi:tryptophan synthase alpha subunit
MTRIVEKYKEEIEREKTTDIICDWCGRSTKGYGEKPYELTIRHHETWGYDGFVVPDLCKECAEKLKNIIIAMGIKVKEEVESYD